MNELTWTEQQEPATRFAMSPSPKISVCMITYNHAEFVTQALDSVLAQRTQFDYEIVIGDDCSTDGTNTIISGYQEEHPGKIKAISRKTNAGMGRNFREILESCTGEYLAILEGDDYWTDPCKLQLQAEYLDRNRGCALCHHKVNHIAWPGGNILKEYPPERFRREHLLPRELARFNYIQTCSVMLRRGLMPALDEEFQELKLGDWPLFVLLNERGWVGYLDRTMSHYRVHSNNGWNNRPASYKLKAMESMAWYLWARVKTRDLWEDTILALAFKEILLALQAADLRTAIGKALRFIESSIEFKKPFWIFTRLWGYYRSYKA
jgi:glycosyltransferase involved in cell wall biosynthesis